MTSALRSPLTQAHRLSTSTIRRAMGRIPTSVAVVTGMTESGPVGMTVGSLATVSHAPPLLTFFALKKSATFAVLRELRSVSINVLDERQSDLCYAFASSQGPKFAVGDWDYSGPGPRLADAPVSFDCAVDSVYEAGDHHGLMARVTDLRTTDSRPMIFFRGLTSKLHPQTGRQIRTNRLDWWSTP